MKSVEPEDTEGTEDLDGPEGSDASVTESALDRPKWDGEYLDRAAERLMYSYDLQRRYAIRGERFDLFDSIWMGGQKQFLHRFINCANHHTMEYMFAWRVDAATVTELEQLVELDHALAGEWIEPDEEHYGAEFTFILTVDVVPEEVRAFVSDFTGRTLLKFDYYDHYEVDLAVITSSGEDAMASRNANSVAAFTLWSGGSPAAADGLLDRLLRKLRR